MIPAGAWREIMTTASSKPTKSYYSIGNVENDFSFQDLLGRLVGDGTTDPMADPQSQDTPRPSANPTAPIDSKQYKWQFND
jgi:hypothetical protein